MDGQPKEAGAGPKIIVKPESVFEQCPLMFSELCGDIWQERFKEYQINLQQDFRYEAPIVLLALRKIMEIENDEEKKGLYNKFLERLNVVDSSFLANTGLKVGVIGGVEGMIFAKLGIKAVNISPSIENLPKYEVSGLSEVPNRLENVVEEYINKFGLTFSISLFDLGSRVRVGHLSDIKEEIDLYSKLFIDVMRITKPGGISIHSGSLMLMEEILNRLGLEAELYGKDDLGLREGIFVIKKKP